MQIFNKLVDSLSKKNYTEFKELVSSSMQLDAEEFGTLIGQVTEDPHLNAMFDIALEDLNWERKHDNYSIL